MCTEVVRPKRFELLTPRFVVWCSIQLSYGRDRPVGSGVPFGCERLLKSGAGKRKQGNEKTGWSKRALSVAVGKLGGARMSTSKVRRR